MGKLISQAWRLAALNLQRNRRRSLLSISIIAIAVLALTSAGGFGLYTYDSLRESTARDVGHLTLSLRGYFEQEEETPLANGLEGSDSIRQALLANPAIRGIQPRIELTGLVSNGVKSTIFVGLGVDYKEFDMKGPFLDLRAGQTLQDPNSPRFDPTQPQVMLGVDLARNLNVAVGDWVTLLATTADGALNALDFQVRGLYSTGVPELDKRQLYLHLTSAQELLNSSKVSTLSVYLFTTEHAASVQGWVEEQLSKLHLPQDLQVTPWQQLAVFYTRVKDLYDRLFGVMGTVMAMVVFVALFNTLTMSVSERTREIGTLSALGAFPNDILAGFVREATLLALCGTLFGTLLNLLTIAVVRVADIQMPPPPGRTEGYPLDLYFSFTLVGLCAVGTVVICVLAAWFSARKGVNKPITEALAYV
ncbi:lipoprotein release ABC transporter permease [Vibrio mimicus]|uniref:ABC transporter permease n=1 Tax=Vibrio mimicus TaxID=674 RepID=UPI0002BA4364|nr:ABC transporter permease [Vibrio mimicus]EMB49802.1 lipoprotein release ABC transporter permease [Vibrio mimicus CAIM 602]MBY7675432.1 ABC transporter permease [Vibrio mimicus]MBY7727321.1 ABC transporter permease [Vibrio mimicus]TXY29935.1 ABC transporter permease [Vibrio mimicus]SUQ23249.1 lipoprotein release ABC transporter permease [Vibrio mimicus]